METKINYNNELKKIIASLDSKKTLLLHACCGPCLTYPLDLLKDHFDITVFYYNPNIYPFEEWDKRLNELTRFLKEYQQACGMRFKLVAPPYDHEGFLKNVVKPGYEGLKEGGLRCDLCHQFRLQVPFKYAADNGFDYFATVMTVSSHKPADFLNKIGLKLEEEFKTTRYLVSDFKKEDGQLKGVKIAKEYQLYRQNYCGCEFSLKDIKKDTI